MRRLVFMIIILVSIVAIFFSSCSSYSSTTHITLDSLKVTNLDYKTTRSLEIKDGTE